MTDENHSMIWTTTDRCPRCEGKTVIIRPHTLTVRMALKSTAYVLFAFFAAKKAQMASNLNLRSLGCQWVR